jgi:Ser/Thr protein kinase RdoA (MazF antagonist)
MNADSLRARVSDYFTHHAASFDLDPNTLIVEYVLNWGGFVNHSYRIRDAVRAYHLKLSASAEDQEALRRWMGLAPVLERYHAPPILEWIDLGPVAGPLFPYLPGSPPTLSEHVVDEVIRVLRRLNADRALATALQPPQSVNARVTYLGSFHDRFTEDLRGIRESRPPFVSEDLLRWLEHEVHVLSQAIASAAAFDEPLTTAVHGDLWLNNILWVSSSDWYLVDWDDMQIGDPAADLAALLGPSARDLRPLKMVEHVEGLLTSTQRARLPHLGRATLLDWVIDPVADWIEVTTAPEHQHAVRAEKERIHKQALACYKELYP